MQRTSAFNFVNLLLLRYTQCDGPTTGNLLIIILTCSNDSRFVNVFVSAEKSF